MTPRPAHKLEPFWQMLLDGDEVLEVESISAASWAAEALLETLRRQQAQLSPNLQCRIDIALTADST